MNEYIITSDAPRRIGNIPNTGVGTMLTLPDGAADAYVALGWIVPRRSEPEAGTSGGLSGDGDLAAQEAHQAVAGGKTTRKQAKAASGPENGG